MNSDPDDAAAAAGGHSGSECRDEEERRADVAGEHLVERVDVELCGRAEERDPRVVDEDVDVADIAREALHVGRMAEIRSDEAGLAAGRYTELGQAIAARIVDEIPGYRSAAPEVIADVRAGATATVELLARTFADGSSVRREDLGFLRGLAARRVHQGVSLEVFTHAYRVALLAYWDACAEEATRLKIPREAGFALASSAIEAIDIITTQAAEAYLREETRIGTQSGRAAPEICSSALSAASRPTPAGATPPRPDLTPPDTCSPSLERSNRQRSRSATRSN
jgi:hypothetical protein